VETILDFEKKMRMRQDRNYQGRGRGVSRTYKKE
jgi:hypothetical protein